MKSARGLAAVQNLADLRALQYLAKRLGLRQSSGAFRYTTALNHLFNRKNCAPGEVELVTKNCVPIATGEFVQSVQLLAPKSDDDWSLKPV